MTMYVASQSETKLNPLNLKYSLQFSDAPFFFDRDESLPETKEASHFVVDLLAKMSIQPSLPRADCSLWKHGAEHCRTVCLARGSARMPTYHSMQVERGADLGLPGRGTPSG